MVQHSSSQQLILYSLKSVLAATSSFSRYLQVFLPELAVLQADPAPSVRKFLPEFLQACPPAALQPATVLLALQCLQGLLQDSVPAVVKAAVMSSSTLFRTALAVVVGQVCLNCLLSNCLLTHCFLPDYHDLLLSHTLRHCLFLLLACLPCRTAHAVMYQSFVFNLSQVPSNQLVPACLP